jgi:hypothetical protein
MIENVNRNSVPKKPFNEMHSERVPYPIVWRFTPKAELLRTFKGVMRFTVPSGELTDAQPPQGGADLPRT